MAFRSSTTTTFSGTGSLTATAPAGVAAHDRLLAAISQDSGTATFTTATGWAALSTQRNTLDGQDGAVHEKKDASGSDAYNFTSDRTSAAVVQVVALSGDDNATAALITASIDNTAVATPITLACAGVTPVATSDVLVFTQLDINAASTTYTNTGPGGYTEREDATAAFNYSAAVYTADSVPPGATGTLTVTATRTAGAGSAAWMGWVVSVPTVGAPAPETVYRRKTLAHPALRDPPIGTRELLDVRMW